MPRWPSLLFALLLGLVALTSCSARERAGVLPDDERVPPAATVSPDAGIALADREDPGGATTGVTDESLALLLLDHWEATMRRYPTWATRLGDHRYDDLLADHSAAALAEARDQERGFRDRARGIHKNNRHPFQTGNTENHSRIWYRLDRAGTTAAVFE